MPKQILMIDDETAFLFPMKNMLGSDRLAVDTADTFQGAMSLLRSKRYDAVIADVRMGGFLSREGLLIVDHVKNRCSGTRVIVMTGEGAPDVMRDARRLRADYYFEKPVSYRMLADALSALGVMDHDRTA